MKELKKLISQGESEKLEFKKSAADWKAIIETVAAFSNSRGGKIIIGVADSLKSAGVKVGKNTVENLTNQILQNTDPKVHPRISIEKISGKNVIVIAVKESPDHLVLAFGRPFKRVGKSTVKMSKDEYENLILEKHKDKLYFDSRICKGATLNDISQEKVKEFLRKAKFERRLNVSAGISIREALERLNLIKGNKLTNAAILLFGRNPQKFFLQAELKCARFKGTEPLEFIDMKVFGGNVIDQRDDGLEFVKEHIKLHAEIKGTERVEKWEYPVEAIREAITNALCHRDYEIAGNVQIRIFDDRIEIWSCGLLPQSLTTEDLKKKHGSILRNPLIGKSFFMIKYIEQWGTGTNRIIEGCLMHGLPEPLFEEISGSLVVLLRKVYTLDALEKLGLNERQLKAAEHIREKSRITNKDYQNLCHGISRETLRKDLNDLVIKKIVVRRGQNKGVYYEFA